jgi:nucleotide-binding universal stress UspA family protein
MRRPIVCATRGGQASRRTQERAIALAKERDADLIFLCVVDPDFAGPVDEELEAALTDELQRLGKCLLHIAEARADKQNVSTATVVQCGPVWESIEAYLHQVNAGALVIGVPHTEAAIHPFGAEKVRQFLQKLEQETDIEIIVVS